MKVILISIGTRGDMEPFLAIGEIIKDKGHQVICAFPEQFRKLVLDLHVEFFSLGTKFIEMLNSNYGYLLNKLSYSIANFGMMSTVIISKKWLKITKKITQKNLGPKIVELVNNKTFKKRAEQIAKEMEKENFTEDIYSSIIESEIL